LSTVGIESSLDVIGDEHAHAHAHAHVTVICQDMISHLGDSLDHFTNLLPGGSKGSEYLKVRLAFSEDTFLATWDFS
jgi:hypothetical protein